MTYKSKNEVFLIAELSSTCHIKYPCKWKRIHSNGIVRKSSVRIGLIVELFIAMLNYWLGAYWRTVVLSSWCTLSDGWWEINSVALGISLTCADSWASVIRPWTILYFISPVHSICLHPSLYICAKAITCHGLSRIKLAFNSLSRLMSSKSDTACAFFTSRKKKKIAHIRVRIVEW